MITCKSTAILVTILLCNLLTSMWYQYRMWSVPLTRFRCLLARVEAYYCCCSDDNNHCHYYSNDDIIHWDYICNNDRYKLQWQPTLLYIKLHCCSLNQTTVYYIVSMKWQSAIGTNWQTYIVVQLINDEIQVCTCLNVSISQGYYSQE